MLVAIAAVIGCEAGTGRVREDVEGPAACGLPRRACEGTEAWCAELVRFAPRAGRGYEDRPLEDERTAETSTSYVRRDVMMAVTYAAAKVACVALGWEGNGGDVALGDMSERDGRVPGTRRGRRRHPPGTHERGRDIDVAYYQRATEDNALRAICVHEEAGVDREHCVAPPVWLDAARTALFVGALFESPRVRVIGVDGMAGPVIEAEVRRLCAAKVIAAGACGRVQLAYEREDGGRGWFRMHHHHLHVSWR